MAVEQAALRNDTKTLRETLDRLEPLMASHGYRMKGVPVGRTDLVGTQLLYEGPADSAVTVDLKKGCVSFVALLKEGSQDYVAPRSAFEHVLSQLTRDGDWSIKRDEVCSA